MVAFAPCLMRPLGLGMTGISYTYTMWVSTEGALDLGAPMVFSVGASALRHPAPFPISGDSTHFQGWDGQSPPQASEDAAFKPGSNDRGHGHIRGSGYVNIGDVAMGTLNVINKLVPLEYDKA